MECDVVQGFVLDADYQGTFGYITALTMGSNSLLADLTGKNPMSASTLPAVGVLSEVEWNGEQMDPISFKAQISSVNKQTLAALLQQGPSSLTVKISFVVFDYDRTTFQFYKALSPLGSSGAGLNGSAVRGERTASCSR